MKTRSISVVRKHLAKAMDEVDDDREAMVVTRKNGAPAVIMSLADYAAMEGVANGVRVNRRRR